MTSLFELHCHSRFSPDGLPEPQDIVLRACQLGLAGVAITDHNTMDGYFSVRDHCPEGVSLIPGMEVDSLQGEVLALFLKQPVPKDLSLEETVERIHNQGGLAICPHPFDDRRSNACVPDRHDPSLFDAMEIFNAGGKNSAALQKAETFAKRHNIPMVAGSDAHTLQGLGKGLTGLDLGEEAICADSLRSVLRHGKGKITRTGFSRFTRFWEDFSKRVIGSPMEGAARLADRKLHITKMKDEG